MLYLRNNTKGTKIKKNIPKFVITKEIQRNLIFTYITQKSKKMFSPRTIKSSKNTNFSPQPEENKRLSALENLLHGGTIFAARRRDICCPTE